MTTPLPINLTNFTGYAMYMNQVSNNLLGTILWIALYVIELVGLSQFGFGRALMWSSFINLISAVGFFVIGILPYYFIVLDIILLVVGIVITQWNYM